MALALATVMHERGVRFDDAIRVSVGQGPFWDAVAQAAGRKRLNSDATRREALYYLKALECRKPIRVK
jgi:hypothetical protein